MPATMLSTIDTPMPQCTAGTNVCRPLRLRYAKLMAMMRKAGPALGRTDASLAIFWSQLDSLATIIHGTATRNKESGSLQALAQS